MRSDEGWSSLEDLFAPLFDDSPPQRTDFHHKLLQGVEVGSDQIQRLGLICQPDIEVHEDVLMAQSPQVVRTLSDVPLLILAEVAEDDLLPNNFCSVLCVESFKRKFDGPILADEVVEADVALVGGDL